MIEVTHRLKNKKLFKIFFALSFPFIAFLLALPFCPKKEVEKNLTQLFEFPTYFFYPMNKNFELLNINLNQEIFFCTKKNELSITSEQVKYYLETKFIDSFSINKVEPKAYLHSARVFRNSNLVKIEVRGSTDEEVLSQAKFIKEDLIAYIKSMNRKSSSSIDIKILSSEIKENHLIVSRVFGIEILFLFFGFVISYLILRKIDFKIKITIESLK